MWLIKCVFGGVICHSPVVIPLPGGVALCVRMITFECFLWLAALAPVIYLKCLLAVVWILDFTSDYLLRWHLNLECFLWLGLVPNAWKSHRYLSIFSENSQIQEYLQVFYFGNLHVISTIFHFSTKVLPLWPGLSQEPTCVFFLSMAGAKPSTPPRYLVKWPGLSLEPNRFMAGAKPSTPLRYNHHGQG